jgi:hypothetical protein
MMKNIDELLKRLDNRVVLSFGTKDEDCTDAAITIRQLQCEHNRGEIMKNVDFLKIAMFGFIPMLLGLAILYVCLVLAGVGVSVTLSPIYPLGLAGGGMLFVAIFLIADMFNNL